MQALEFKNIAMVSCLLIALGFSMELSNLNLNDTTFKRCSNVANSIQESSQYAESLRHRLSQPDIALDGEVVIGSAGTNMPLALPVKEALKNLDDAQALINTYSISPVCS